MRLCIGFVRLWFIARRPPVGREKNDPVENRAPVSANLTGEESSTQHPRPCQSAGLSGSFRVTGGIP